MVALRVGQFDRRVRIERLSRDEEADGQVVGTWELHCERWAERVEQAATEAVRESVQNAPQRSVTWRVRRDSETAAITEQMRLVHGSRTYGIESAHDETGDRTLVTLATTERREP